jgi:hypothetical protein
MSSVMYPKTTIAHDANVNKHCLKSCSMIYIKICYLLDMYIIQWALSEIVQYKFVIY